MITQPESIVEGCSCDPYPAEAQEAGCEGCAPNMYMTCAEEAVLARMRELKEQVRPISLRMKEIEHSAEEAGTAGSGEFGEEWAGLAGQLETLRGQWCEWEELLDAAIERKMILLGHREG